MILWITLLTTSHMGLQKERGSEWVVGYLACELRADVTQWCQNVYAIS